MRQCLGSHGVAEAGDPEWLDFGRGDGSVDVRR